MNIIAETLNSKPSTQAMLTCFLLDMKQYFKNCPLVSEDKTYSRILKVAETTQKFIPHFYSLNNIALKLINTLRQKVDDVSIDIQKKYQCEKIENQVKELNDNKDQNQSSDTDEGINSLDIESLQKLQMKLSRENDNDMIVSALGRQVNLEYMRKVVLDTIEQMCQDIEECEDAIVTNLRTLLDEDSIVFLFDSHLQNKHLVNLVANEKKIKLKLIKTNNADYKNNEINLADIGCQIRKAQKVIISAESILRNGAIISESGSLMVALVAKKYNIEVIVLARGFCLTHKSLIDQHTLLSQNPMRFLKRKAENQLKVFIAKRLDLVESRLVSQIVNQLGIVNPSNLEMQFISYYNLN